MTTDHKTKARLVSISLPPTGHTLGLTQPTRLLVDHTSSVALALLQRCVVLSCFPPPAQLPSARVTTPHVGFLVGTTHPVRHRVRAASRLRRSAGMAWLCSPLWILRPPFPVSRRTSNRAGFFVVLAARPRAPRLRRIFDRVKPSRAHGSLWCDATTKARHPRELARAWPQQTTPPRSLPDKFPPPQQSPRPTDRRVCNLALCATELWLLGHRNAECGRCREREATNNRVSSFLLKKNALWVPFSFGGGDERPERPSHTRFAHGHSQCCFSTISNSRCHTMLPPHRAPPLATRYCRVLPGGFCSAHTLVRHTTARAPASPAHLCVVWGSVTASRDTCAAVVVRTLCFSSWIRCENPGQPVVVVVVVRRCVPESDVLPPHPASFKHDPRNGK